MAIAGLIVHCQNEKKVEVTAAIELMPEMSIYGNHREQYIVVVAESPSGEMEPLVSRLETVDGVLAVYTSYVSVEDELTDVQ